MEGLKESRFLLGETRFKFCACSGFSLQRFFCRLHNLCGFGPGFSDRMGCVLHYRFYGRFDGSIGIVCHGLNRLLRLCPYFFRRGLRLSSGFVSSSGTLVQVPYHHRLMSRTLV